MPSWARPFSRNSLSQSKFNKMVQLKCAKMNEKHADMCATCVQVSNWRPLGHLCFAWDFVKRVSVSRLAKKSKLITIQTITFPPVPSPPCASAPSLTRSFPQSLPPSQGGNRSSSKSIYTNSRFTAFMRPASNIIQKNHNFEMFDFFCMVRHFTCFAIPCLL